MENFILTIVFILIGMGLRRLPGTHHRHVGAGILLSFLTLPLFMQLL